MNRREFVRLTTGAAVGSTARIALSSDVEAQTIPSTELGEQPVRRARGDWSFYPSDDFDTPYLKRRWLIRDTDVRIVSGRVILTNPDGETGSIQLKGCYDNRSANGQSGSPKIYLRWPWAVETRMTIPSETTDARPFCGKLAVKLCNDDGLQAPVEIARFGGFGANWLAYGVEGVRNKDWISDGPEIASRDLYLRIEAVGDDGRSIRCGTRARAQDPWIWSEVHQLSQQARWAESLGLFNSNVGDSLEQTGALVSLAFDYLHFEGACFEFEKRGTVEFIRPSVESVKIAKPRGQRWESRVPATLDLSERCALALNALTGAADPTAEYEIYGMVLSSPHAWTNHDLNYYNPDIESALPVMVHDFGDDLLQSKVVEAIPLMRIASGSNLNAEACEKMLQWLRRLIGEDGLVYHPLRGRPWALFAFSGVNPFSAEAEAGQMADAQKVQYAGLTPGRLMLALGAWYAVTQDPGLKSDMQRMAIGLATKTNTMEWASVAHPIAEGALIQGLAKCYRLTGCEPARDLAAKLMCHFRTAYYEEDGTFKFAHFHTSTFGLLAMLEFAQAVNNRELIQQVARGYEYGRTKGWSIVGYFPEGVGQRPATCETCETAEMTGLAVKLSAAGAGDYWDDADQYLRNQYSDNQLLLTEWITEMVHSDPHPPAKKFNCDGTRDVANRLVGWFTSYGSANSWFTDFPRAPGPVACCLGNGSRGLYYVWENMVRHEAGAVRVNLLLNRTSPWADVDSHIPFSGRVDIRMKQDAELLVRIPANVPSQHVNCMVNDRRRALSWNGRYASAGRLVNGDFAKITFPLEETIVKQKIGEQHCTLTLKGNTVVAIEPRPAHFPLYQRAPFRAGQTQWKNRERFLSDQLIDW